MKRYSSEKGALGVDISVAIVILIMFVGTIAGLFTNLSLTSKKIERKSVATNIAIKLIEELKMADSENLNIEEPITIEKINEFSNDEIEIPNGYNTEISIENYKNEEKIKIVTVSVKYRDTKNTEDNVEIRTLIIKDNIN